MNGTDSPPGIALAGTTDTAQRFASGRAFTVIALVLLTFGAYWPSTLSLMASWEDTVGRTYTHGYVVMALALWLIWRDRMSWATGPARPFLPAVALLVVGALGWLVAWRAGLQIVHQAALPALAASAVLAMFGWRTLRALAFPLAWLYLAIPIWDAVRPLLNWISVMAVRLLLRIADIPAYFVNNTFEIPSGAFTIADGCSGLHFFVVALTISLLYGQINRDVLRTRVKLVVFALLLAMATNWLRIFIIILAGHLTNMQHRLVVHEHYSFGWYMFAGMMVLYFLIVRRWPAAPTALPEAGPPVDEMLPRRGALVAALGLAVAPACLYLDANLADDAQLARAMRADVVLQQSEVVSDWQPRFAGATREVRGVLHAGETQVEVYVAGYRVQRQGEELIGFHNELLGEQLHRAPGSLPAPAPWIEQQAIGATDHWVIWSAYRLDGRWYRSPLRLQIDYGIHSLTGAPAAAVIALRARCGVADCTTARESLKQIVETRYP